MSEDHEFVTIQVKVPVCVTLRLKRQDAEWMYRGDLCRVVDGVLESSRVGGPDGPFEMVQKDLETFAEYALTPHWDKLPDDECELTMYEDGLFPCQDDNDPMTIP